MNRRELLREMSRVQAVWVNRNTPGTGDVNINVEDEQEYLTKIAAVFERAREDVRRRRGRTITAAQATAAISALLLAYDPKQPRDRKGRWTDGTDQSGPSAPATRSKPKSRSSTNGGSSLSGRQAALRKGIESGHDSAETLSGGEAADVQLITMKDGSRAVRKTTTEDMGNWSPKDQTDAEELGSLIADAMGVRAPAVQRVNEDTAYLEYMPGTPAIKAHGRGVPADILNSDDGIRMGLMDYLTNNTDRHAGNWLVGDDGAITAIDNGMMFNYSTSVGHNPFGKAHFDLDSPNPLTPADVAKVRERLEVLRLKFAEMGRTRWFGNMMDLLDDVAQGATGTKDLY